MIQCEMMLNEQATQMTGRGCREQNGLGYLGWKDEIFCDVICGF